MRQSRETPGIAGQIYTCTCGLLLSARIAKCPKCGKGRAGTGPEATIATGSGGKTPGKGKKTKEPNKLEQRYVDMHPGYNWKFEGVSFRLASGHRYTPDWYQPNTRTVVECKPAAVRTKAGKLWRHASYQRARLAFDEARVQFPEFDFIWAEWDGERWAEK
jgi:hypothetical protein